MVTCVFKLLSGGSAVRETMFPGTDHEMTNMYHLDGHDLVLTHYCAEGNQSRMRAKPGGKNNVLEFKFESFMDSGHEPLENFSMEKSKRKTAIH